MNNILKLFRPATLVAPSTGALFMALLSIHVNTVTIGWLTVLKLCVGIMMMAMANAAGNIINHVVDSYDTDLYHPTKRNRPIASGQIDRMVAISLTVYIFGAAMAISYILFGLLTGILMSVILFFSWAYSAPPRFKKRFISSNLAIGTPRGFLGVVAAYSFFGTPTLSVLAFGLILGVFVFGVNTTKDIGDHDADKAAGIRNFVTVMGIERAVKYVIKPFLYIPFGLWFIYLTTLGTFDIRNYMMFGAMIVSIATHRELNRHRKSELENDRTWYLFYGEMAVMILLYTVPHLL